MCGIRVTCASAAAVPTPASHTILSEGKTRRGQPVDVLLLDAQYRQTLVCMRVYAAAGLRVGAVACASEAWWAPSFKSRWCSLRVTAPDFELDADAYVNALLEQVDAYPARMILAAHDGSIAALRPRRSEIERRIALPLASEAALDIAVSKSRTLALAEDLGIAVPTSIPVSDIADVSAATAHLGYPVVIKPVQSWVERDGIGTRLSCGVAQTADQAKRTIWDMLSAGGDAVVQQWLPGRREAVSLFFAHDKFWARFAQVSHREWPLLGGASVLCESIPLPPDITSPSERLVRAMNLEGCSMVEFRRDQVGRPFLMEVNPRMAGSVALAVASGVNFPRLTYAWATGAPLQTVTSYQVGSRLRWLAGDIWNLKCVFDSQGQPDAPRRGQAVTRFLADFVRRPSALDLRALTDMRPGLAEMHKSVLVHAHGRIRRSSPVRWLTGYRKVT